MVNLRTRRQSTAPPEKPNGAAPAVRKRGRPSAVPKSEKLSSDDLPAQPAKRPRKARASSAAPPPTKAELQKQRLARLRAQSEKLSINPLPEWPQNRSRIDFTFDYNPVVPTHENPYAVFVCGDNGMAQLGLGIDAKNEDGDMYDEVETPIRHELLTSMFNEGKLGEDGLQDACAGGMHSLIIDSEGKVLSWGINDNAALGRLTAKQQDSQETLESQPMVVPSLQNENRIRATRVAAGDSISVAVSSEGEVYSWGSFRASDGLLGFSEKSPLQFEPVLLGGELESKLVTQVACGNDHVVALTTAGTVVSHGQGQLGQLGRKLIERHKIKGLTPERVAPRLLKNIVLIGCGNHHSFAVTQAGQVYAWGLNTCYQLGLPADDGGNSEVIFSPTLVPSLNPEKHNGARVVSIQGGEHHSVFLFSDGTVWACGRCDAHDVGLPTNHPKMVELAEARKAAKVERDQFMQEEKDRIKAKCEAKGLSYDDSVALGDAANLGFSKYPAPVEGIAEPTQLTFPGDAKIVQITSGTQHSLAVSSTGEVFAWGLSLNSQLGIPDMDDSIAKKPRRVKSDAFDGYKIVKVVTGGQHTIFLGVKSE